MPTLFSIVFFLQYSIQQSLYMAAVFMSQFPQFCSSTRRRYQFCPWRLTLYCLISVRGSPTYAVFTTAIFGLCTRKRGIFTLAGDPLQSHYLRGCSQTRLTQFDVSLTAYPPSFTLSTRDTRRDH